MKTMLVLLMLGEGALGVCAMAQEVEAKKWQEMFARDTTAVKAATKAFWNAAQVYYQDKGEWPLTVKQLTQGKYPYAEVDSQLFEHWYIGINQGPPVNIVASFHTDDEDEGVPSPSLAYEIASGLWTMNTFPRDTAQTLSPEKRAELAADARNAMRAIWEGAKVFYNDKGEWPKTVAELDADYYIGLRMAGAEDDTTYHPDMVSPSIYHQWQFAVIGNPVQSVVAISKEGMPGGAGHGIEYDVANGAWRGYGMTVEYQPPAAPIRLKEYKKSR